MDSIRELLLATYHLRPRIRNDCSLGVTQCCLLRAIRVTFPIHEVLITRSDGTDVHLLRPTQKSTPFTEVLHPTHSNLGLISMVGYSCGVYNS